MFPVESRSTSEKTRPVFMDFSMKVMFHQGLWYEDPDQDLNQDLHFYSPRLARFVVRHPYLRDSLRVLRVNYPGIFCIESIAVIISHSVHIYKNWGNKDKIMINCTEVCALTYIMLMLLIFASKQKQLKFIRTKMENFATSRLDDDSEKKQVDDSILMCNKVSKYLLLGILGVTSLSMLYLVLFKLVPKRKMLNEYAVPYDITKSPAFELSTIFIYLYFNQITCMAFTLIPVPLSLLIHVNTLWNILNLKLQSIVSPSTRKVQYLVKKEPNVINLERLQTDRIASDPIGLQIASITEDEEDILWCAYQGQGQGGSAQLEGDSQETAVESVEGERRQNTSGLYPYDEEETVGSLNPAVDQEMQLQLAKHAQQHSELLSITYDIGQYLNETLSVTTGLYATLIALLVWASFNTNDHKRSYIYGLFGFVFSLSCLVVCYLADNITSQSAAVGQTLYDCDWPRASKSFKKKMLIVMTVANVPVYIKPTGVEPFSLKLYAEVNNNAYKMLATIQSFAK